LLRATKISRSYFNDQVVIGRRNSFAPYILQLRSSQWCVYSALNVKAKRKDQPRIRHDGTEEELGYRPVEIWWRAQKPDFKFNNYFPTDANYSVYYICVGSSTCFEYWHPSSGARTTVITAFGTDWLQWVKYTAFNTNI